MAAGHGGARTGAGRKPKTKAAEQPAVAPVEFADPLAYLVAVSRGTVPGDSLRVAAAKAALPYTVPKTRAPVASPPPTKMRAQAERAGNVAEIQDWNARAAEVRRRLAKVKT